MERWKSAIILAVLLIASSLLFPVSSLAQEVETEAKSAILVDANTGDVLFKKEADLTLPPASMTKMMTEYLVMEAIEEGEISWDTTTQISDYPYSISANPSFSGVGLTQNQDYTVRSLYEAMAINSDNATSIALAELIAGSEGEFVKMMNEKAAELGMEDYKFVNSTGLSNSDLGGNVPEGTSAEDTNLMSARAAATLAYHLVNDYPEALEISGTPTTEFDGQTIQNWNWMIPGMPGYLSDFGYEGVDGLKTGYTELAGNTFTGTVERDGQRLISVVMKTSSREQRFEETRKLFNYGFEQFEKQELFGSGYQMEDKETLPVTKGKEDQVAIETGEALSRMIKQGEEEAYSIEYKLKEEELTAPVEAGQQVGEATLVYEGEVPQENIVKENPHTVPVVAASAVEKSNWFMLTLGNIGSFFGNIFTGAVDMVKGWF
ncbi:serine hydrolase [Salimicrobium halophilum]|uniref:serine-type D-Ala-D-Ala carboxypeptidase n=1 Tax=Salimicrobium halophilum TaxID=86666 RepID=A0A1G8UPG6_9BACI|nr:serine hydrolase [Salimicrobium halophilum]SDJ55619.1 D-Ala-D-Ala carboxypeptidase A. Serine peptidase. MEROPS family S11 [Salimicrobium halophilum]